MPATIDEVLDILHRTGPDLAGGNSNHGPMVAETLCALGRSDAVLPWLAGYKHRFQERPPTRHPLSPRDWQACAAIYAWYSTTPSSAPADLTPPVEGPEVLIDRAVVAGGAHTIKFTEACLREYALHPQPVYLVAARDAAERVGAI